MAGNLLEVTGQNFAAEVLSSTQPVLVDFWAPWCSPCRALTPVLDELATEYAGKIKIAKVNVDNEQDLAVQYNISGIPALLIFKNGQVVEQMAGLRSKRDLKVSLDRV